MWSTRIYAVETLRFGQKVFINCKSNFKLVTFSGKKKKKIAISISLFFCSIFRAANEFKPYKIVVKKKRMQVKNGINRFSVFINSLEGKCKKHYRMRSFRQNHRINDSGRDSSPYLPRLVRHSPFLILFLGSARERNISLWKLIFEANFPSNLLPTRNKCSVNAIHHIDC